MTSSLPKRLVEFAFNTAAAAIIVIDSIARPIYRPVIEWANSIEFIKAAEERVARLPRFAILALFTVPFLIAEPAKVLALVWIAEGSLFSGALLLALSYLATFLLVERIYHAGCDKLLTYVWFAWAVRQLSVIREKLAQSRRRIATYLSGFLK